MMVLMYWARAGTSMPAICSAARQNVIACTLEQMPQTRSINVTAGTHSRLWTNSSMARQVTPISMQASWTVSAAQ